MTIILSWAERILGVLTIITLGYVFSVVIKVDKKDASSEKDGGKKK